jgi:hypothetical protein
MGSLMEIKKSMKKPTIRDIELLVSELSKINGSNGVLFLRCQPW